MNGKIAADIPTELAPKIWNGDDQEVFSIPTTQAGEELSQFNVKQPSHSVQVENGFPFFEIALALGREKKLFCGTGLLSALTAAIVSFFLTPVFTARTIVMPPQQQVASNPVLDQLGSLANVAGMGSNFKNPIDLYVALLRSDAVHDYLIDHFQLKSRYKTSSLVATRGILDERVKISNSRTSGLITIEVSDSNPQFAAELTNAHIEALQQLMGKLALSEAQKRRVFSEQQMEKVSAKPFRDIRVQEAILASLIRQYELARIDESREGLLLQQVDFAVAPERRSKPQRSQIVMLWGAIGLLVGAAAGILRQGVRHSNWEFVRSDDILRIKKAWSLFS